MEARFGERYDSCGGRLEEERVDTLKKIIGHDSKSAIESESRNAVAIADEVGRKKSAGKFSDDRPRSIFPHPRAAR